MGLIEMASGNSVWRGMDYYENKKVVSWEQTGTDTYDGIVSGSGGNRYTCLLYTSQHQNESYMCPVTPRHLPGM